MTAVLQHRRLSASAPLKCCHYCIATLGTPTSIACRRRVLYYSTARAVTELRESSDRCCFATSQVLRPLLWQQRHTLERRYDEPRSAVAVALQLTIAGCSALCGSLLQQ